MDNQDVMNSNGFISLFADWWKTAASREMLAEEADRKRKEEMQYRNAV